MEFLNCVIFGNDEDIPTLVKRWLIENFYNNESQLTTSISISWIWKRRIIVQISPRINLRMEDICESL